MKILLVDDDEFVRTLLEEHLHSEGFDVTSKNNVDDAMVSLDGGDFDLLISDIVMPGKDGGQLMKHVKESGVNLPILAITGGVENAQEDYAHYADFFADETLVKPIKKEELIQVVRRLAGGKG